MTDEHKAALATGSRRGSGRARLPRVAARQQAASADGKRTPDSITKRLDAIESELATADALTELKLLQERRDLQAELESKAAVDRPRRARGCVRQGRPVVQRAPGHLLHDVARGRRRRRRAQQGRHHPAYVTPTPHSIPAKASNTASMWRSERSRSNASSSDCWSSVTSGSASSNGAEVGARPPTPASRCAARSR